jgi:hypothetical protein
VEIEGKGVPLSPKNSFLYVKQTWANWQPEFEAAAEATGVPAVWLLALATVESGLWAKNPESQRTITSSAGARGIMQIMPLNAPSLGISPAELFVPATNILSGARLFRDMAKGKAGDYVGATGKYNSGSLCCPGRNAYNLCTDSVDGISYPELAARYVNSAILELGLGKTESGGGSILPWLVGGAVGLLAFAWVKRR